MNTIQAEFYVKLSPLTPMDQKPMTKTKVGPQLRLKISYNSSLSSVANYLKNIVSQHLHFNFDVSLYAPSDEKNLRLPLSLSISELIFIMGVSDSPDLYYSFDEKAELDLPTSTPIPPKMRYISSPNMEMSPPMQSPPQKTDSQSSPLCDILHSGIFMYSNSFGAIFPSGLDGSNSNGIVSSSSRPQTEESLSLRKDLEALLQKA